MKAIKLLIVSCGLLPFSTPSMGKIDEYPTTTTRQIAAHYGGCVVAKRSRAKLAREFIVTGADGNELTGGGRYSALVEPDCMKNPKDSMVSVEMQFPGGFYRYALAEALVRLDFPESRFADFQSVPAFGYPEPPVLDVAALPKNEKKAQAVRDNIQQQQTMIALGRFAECVARTDPVATHALLVSDVATPEEDSRFKAINPVLGSCLSGGSTVKLGKTAIRGALGLTYYRLAYAASVAQGVTPGGTEG